LTRLETLKKLESVLERFLAGVVEIETEQIEAFRGIDTLDDIAKDSFKGRFINNQLGNWFARYGRVVDGGRLKEDEVSTIANILSEIKSGLDSSDPETKKLSDEIERWREKGVVPKRKLVLKMKGEGAEQNIAEKFVALLKQESEHLEFEQKGSAHLISILDDILKSAEAKEDRMFMHLAGSVIYYLKINGYKVGPFVRRLKEIEKNKFGVKDVV